MGAARVPGSAVVVVVVLLVIELIPDPNPRPRPHRGAPGFFFSGFACAGVAVTAQKGGADTRAAVVHSQEFRVRVSYAADLNFFDEC